MANSVLDHVIKKYYNASLDIEIKDFTDFDVRHVVEDIIGLINSYEFKDTIPGYEAAYRVEKINLILKGLKGIEERLNS
ncbi:MULTISPECIES: hypothetical protein [Oceanobacillus]|uniref:hypothetical protein n=1 Tax=Oceanobacillus TaxID=182709 RepID=UPI000595B37B|nr:MULTISPECIES: hypothetical protein [Oceanobacillus]